MANEITYSSLSDVDVAKYDARVRVKAAARVVLPQFFEQEDVIAPAHVAYFTIFSKLDSTYTSRLLTGTYDVDEPPNIAVSDTQTGITAVEIGGTVCSMKAARTTAVLDILKAKERLISINMAETIEETIAYKLFSAITTPSGWKQSGAALDSGLILKARTTLKNNSIPRRAGNLYGAVIDPFTEADIFSDADALKGFIPVTKYADPKSVYLGELGAFMGFRWHVSPKAYTVESGGVTYAYPLFFGENAFGQANGYDPTIEVWEGRDAMRRKVEISWLGQRGYGVIDSDAVVEVEVQPNVF